MKLSAAQQKVIDKMKGGWGLGYSHGLSGVRAWLQEGAVGHGGQSEKVSLATFRALRSFGLIECAKTGFPTSVYVLTNRSN